MYDHQKVQNWIAKAKILPRNAPLDLWQALVCGPPYIFPTNLVIEYREASTWERVNMLYGLRDHILHDVNFELHLLTEKARKEDDLRG